MLVAAHAVAAVCGSVSLCDETQEINMNHTLAAVFETRAEANLAKEELVHNGYDRERIKIHDSASVAGTGVSVPYCSGQCFGK